MQGKRRMDTDVIKLIESKHEVRNEILLLNIYAEFYSRSQFLGVLTNFASNFMVLNVLL